MTQYAYTTPRLNRVNDSRYTDPQKSTALIDSEGDFIIGADDDILIASAKEAIFQRLIWFLNTVKGSCKMYPTFGSRIHLLFGKSTDNLNVINEATTNLISDLETSLFFPVREKVKVLPYQPGTILILIAVYNTINNSEIISQTYSFDSSTRTVEYLGATTL